MTGATPQSLLQPGIYIERSVPPPPAWRLLLLDVAPGTQPAAARAALERVTTMLDRLRRGVLRELTDTRPGEQPAAIATDTFDVLLGFGASFFDARRHDPPLTRQPRPAHLVALRRDGPAFPSLHWTRTDDRGGEADLALQFTGINSQAVDRAAVEVWGLIDELALPLTVAGSYDGRHRDDGRSWIGFHDGVGNIEPSQRRAAVECPGDPAWNAGGTYLAFLRLEVALRAWRRLSRGQQEAIVGRDKLSGLPLGSTPAAAGSGDGYLDPPETGDRLIEASHLHRVNQNRAAGTTNAGHRIFRQGYEYLEALTPDGPRLGLNFVSFQNDLEQVQQILGLRGWLGDVNFGGPAQPGPGDPPQIRLTTLRAGGFYAVPPCAQPFPGAGLFG